MCCTSLTGILRLRLPPFTAGLLVVCLLLAVLPVVHAASGQAIVVEASPLRDIAIYPQYKAPATVVTLNDSQLSAEVKAVVATVSVEVGQVVRKGEVLVRLNKKDFELALQREQAEITALEQRIDFARYQLQRAQTLQQQQAVSEELLKQRETDLAVLESEKRGRDISIQQARRNIDKCDIRAPFDAVISEKLVSIGELANPGTPLLRVVDAQRREVTAKLQSYQIASLRSAAHVIFLHRSEEFPVKLRSVLPLIDAKERTQELRLVFEGATALAGSAGELVWKNQQAHVPAEMLIQREGQLGVFIVNKDGRASFTALPDAAEGRPALVEFSMDTRIVTKGRFRLQDGDALTIQ